ncbi:hypothetical protein HDV05_008257 [Chytridiales sp. JEL 0842]|nr:hypothetical protein HDV05_008257 [Chytridiales sp. JEL 0842]
MDPPPILKLSKVSTGTQPVGPAPQGRQDQSDPSDFAQASHMIVHVTLLSADPLPTSSIPASAASSSSSSSADSRKQDRQSPASPTISTLASKPPVQTSVAPLPIPVTTSGSNGSSIGNTGGDDLMPDKAYFTIPSFNSVDGSSPIAQNYYTPLPPVPYERMDSQSSSHSYASTMSAASGTSPTGPSQPPSAISALLSLSNVTPASPTTATLNDTSTATSTATSAEEVDATMQQLQSHPTESHPPHPHHLLPSPTAASAFHNPTSSSSTPPASPPTSSNIPSASSSGSNASTPLHILVGNLVSPCHFLKDLQGRRSMFFVFSDISVRVSGHFRLRFQLFNIGSSTPAHPASPNLAVVYSKPFQVFHPKEFPGLSDSTMLSRCLAQQGVRIHIRGDGFRAGVGGPVKWKGATEDDEEEDDEEEGNEGGAGGGESRKGKEKERTGDGGHNGDVVADGDE